jgi:hypothetical protein
MAGRRGAWTVDVGSVGKLAAAFKVASPSVAKSFRASMRDAADATVKDARQRIEPHSSKIGGTIRRGGSVGTLTVSAGGAKAPSAAPFENGGEEGDFRHPVMGDMDVWVNQKAHPFLHPAAEAQSEALAVKVDAAIDEAIKTL